MKRLRKKTLTLLEIMIVIFLITLVTGVIGYNMKGSLDRGKAFRSRMARDQLYDALHLLMAEGNDPSQLIANPRYFLTQLNLAKNPDQLLKDGWGDDFEITLTRDRRDFKITSPNANRYEN